MFSSAVTKHQYVGCFSTVCSLVNYSLHAEHCGTMRLKIQMRCHFAVEHSSPMSPKRMVDGKDVFHQVQTDINSSIKLLVRWLSSCSLDGQFSSGQGSRVRYYSSTVIQTSKRRKVKRVLKCKTHVWFVFCLLSNLAFQNCFTSTTRAET